MAILPPNVENTVAFNDLVADTIKAENGFVDTNENPTGRTTVTVDTAQFRGTTTGATLDVTIPAGSAITAVKFHPSVANSATNVNIGTTGDPDAYVDNQALGTGTTVTELRRTATAMNIANDAPIVIGVSAVNNALRGFIEIEFGPVVGAVAV